MSNILDLNIDFDLIPDFKDIALNNSHKRYAKEKTYKEKLATGFTYDARILFLKENKENENGKMNCKCCGKETRICRGIIDHIMPLSCGGDNNIENLQFLCKKCDRKKGKIDNHWSNALNLCASWDTCIVYREWRQQAIKACNVMKYMKAELGSELLLILPFLEEDKCPKKKGEIIQGLWHNIRKNKS